MSKYCETCKYSRKHNFGVKSFRCDHCECMEIDGEETSEPTMYEEYNLDVHMKGYIYDSLVYRYKFALEQATEIRAAEINAQNRNTLSKVDSLAKARDLNNRDVLRFCQILDEAIGEHD